MIPVAWQYAGIILAAATFLATCVGITFAILSWRQGRRNAEEISRIHIGDRNTTHIGDQITTIYVDGREHNNIEHARSEAAARRVASARFESDRRDSQR